MPRSAALEQLCWAELSDPTGGLVWGNGRTCGWVDTATSSAYIHAITIHKYSPKGAIVYSGIARYVINVWASL